MSDSFTLREVALALPGVYETADPPPSFWVGGHVLARSGVAVLAVRVPDDVREAYLASAPGVFFVTVQSEARHEVLIRLSTATLSDVVSAVGAAWRACAPAALVREVDARRAAGTPGPMPRWPDVERVVSQNGLSPGRM